VNNEEISPIKKNTNSGQKKPLSYNEASLKQLLKRSIDSSPGGNGANPQPQKILERRTSAKKEGVPTFFFNIPDTKIITEKGLITEMTEGVSYDLSHQNDQSQSFLHGTEIRYNGYNEHLSSKGSILKESERTKNNRSPFHPQYSLIKITSMEFSPTNKDDENTNTQYSQPDEIKTSLGYMITEPTDPMVRVNTNPQKKVPALEKAPKRTTSTTKKRQNSCNFPKKPPTHNNTINLKPKVAAAQKPKEVKETKEVKEQSLGRKSSTSFFQNEGFSFEMTYFKPIDESKLDEYIQSVNESRGIMSPFRANTPENSPLKKRPSESRERKIPETKLNLSQDIFSRNSSIVSNNRSLLVNKQKSSMISHNNNKSTIITSSNKESNLHKHKEEEKKTEKSFSKKTPTKSSEQKPKSNNLKSNQGNNIPAIKLSTVPSKPSLTPSKSKSKLSSISISHQPHSEQNTEPHSASTTHSKKSTTKKTGESSRSNSKTKTPAVQKTNKVSIETEDGNTYSKLDRLLQDLKTNITRTTNGDISCTATETPSDIGLFNQSSSSEMQKEPETVNTDVPKKSFKKSLIAALEKQ